MGVCKRLNSVAVVIFSILFVSYFSTLVLRGAVENYQKASYLMMVMVMISLACLTLFKCTDIWAYDWWHNVAPPWAPWLVEAFTLSCASMLTWLMDPSGENVGAALRQGVLIPMQQVAVGAVGAV